MFLLGFDPFCYLQTKINCFTFCDMCKSVEGAENFKWALHWFLQVSTEFTSYKRDTEEKLEQVEEEASQWREQADRALAVVSVFGRQILQHIAAYLSASDCHRSTVCDNHASA